MGKLTESFQYTQREYWGGSWYPYWTLMVITVLGGLFGLDHFWLRSPVSGVAKVFVNLFTFGLWYVYDIVQIFKDKELVMKHGLSAPIVGPLGIGAGVFKDTNPDGISAKSPFRWFLYLILTMLPFGFDFFIAGDTNGAFARFLTSFIWFLWPIGFVWGILSTARAIFMPQSLWDNGTYRMFPFNFFMSTYGPSTLGPKDVPDRADACDPGGASGFWRSMIGFLPPFLQTAVATFFPGVVTAVEGVAAATTAVAGTAKIAANSAGQVISAATGTAVPVISAVSTVAKELPGAVTAVGRAGDIAGQELQKLSNPATLQKMVGGGSSSSAFEDTAVFALLVAVIGGGAYLGYSRYMQKKASSRNDKSSDDTPPKPSGV